ncbi:hypothetical protein AB691_0920 [Stutzerimonas stutzeri]|nr:hypothetical protein AB691_0920 [Stutzerimonas stutzeri]
MGGVELGQRHGRASCRGFRSFAAAPTSGRTVGAAANVYGLISR